MTDQRRDIDITSLPFFNDPAATTMEIHGTPPASAANHLLAAAAGGAKPVSASAAPHARAQDAVATPAGSSTDFELSRKLDWDVIRTLRGQVSELLTKSLEASPNMTEASQHEQARAHIIDVIQAHVDDMVRHSGSSNAWNGAMKNTSAMAVFDSLFRLGRLQPLINLPDVENVDIYGYDNVWVTYSDGTKRAHDPIASSDAELMSEIQFLAARSGEDGRSFTATNPDLDMDLPGGARLAAVAPPVSPRPKIVIRIHRFVDITLNDLVTTHKTLTAPAGALLDASVQAGLSIVVSGHPGAGKTTLVRALAGSIEPLEKIVTIEKERELYLDRMGDRHKIVSALQYRPGQGERAPDGSRPGEVSLVQLLEKALRLDAQRIIVGEVRGGEIDAMFQAMQAGVGSMSTLHASNPTNAIERMATLTQKSLNTTAAYAYRQIAQHINLIVQISKVNDRVNGGVRRIVSEICEVQAGESIDGSRPIAAPIFKADPVTLELRPVGRPTTQMLEQLKHWGFDERHLSGIRDVA